MSGPGFVLNEDPLLALSHLTQRLLLARQLSSFTTGKLSGVLLSKVILTS